MKSKLFTILILFVFTSCESSSISMVDGFYENGNPQRVNYYSSIYKSQLLKKELYYESGQIKLIGNYKRNKKHGQWLYYFENGSKSSESWFFNGLLDGRSTSFYKNGKLRTSGYYQKGKRIRIWAYFDEEGQLVKKVDFSSKKRL